MQVIDEAVSRFPNRKPEWTFSGGLFLNGLIAMYRASGKIEYRSAALGWMEKNVSSEGAILQAPVCTMDLAACGKALFFALDETGGEPYKMALDAVADRVKEKHLPDTPAGLYAVMPFLAEYDTRFGGRQTYKAMSHQFQAVHQAMFVPEKGLYCAEDGRFSILDEGFMLMALADTAETLDMQIYEHYRTLADMFLETVRCLLTYRIQEIGLLTDSVIDSDDLLTMDGNLMTAYALFKGIRLGLLEDEKYMPIALQMVSAMHNTCGSDLLDSDFPGNLCYRIMTEAEMIEVKKG